MVDCDKFKKKYNIGFIILLSIIPVAMYGQGESGWILFLAALYIMTSTVISLVLMLPYYTCLTNSSNSRKPPFSR